MAEALSTLVDRPIGDSSITIGTFDPKKLQDLAAAVKELLFAPEIGTGKNWILFSLLQGRQVMLSTRTNCIGQKLLMEAVYFTKALYLKSTRSI